MYIITLLLLLLFINKAGHKSTINKAGHKSTIKIMCNIIFTIVDDGTLLVNILYLIG